MTQLLRSIYRKLGTLSLGIGLDPRKLLRSALNFCSFPLDLFHFYNLSLKTRSFCKYYFPISILPVLSDANEDSGSHGVYFYQDLVAAQLIYKQNSSRHLDIGSRLDGFIAHLLSFRHVDFADIRPLKVSIVGLNFIQMDLMDTIQCNTFFSKYDSVSCLHALEHFGLGRYSDPLNPLGWYVALTNIIGLVAIDGFLYLSVPVGRQRVEFNSQRIFSPSVIIDFVTNRGMKCCKFFHITDSSCLSVPIDSYAFNAIEINDCDCGLFVFQRVGN